LSAEHLNRSGRRAGVPNRFTGSIKEMILGALSDVGGREYLARQAEENPTAFLGLVGKVLPLQLAGADGGALVVDFRWAEPVPVTQVVEAKEPAPQLVFDVSFEEC
jgi:hypothetical protein